MGEDAVGQYRIIAYIDDMEEAMRLGKKSGFKEDLIGDIKNIHEETVDMSSLLETEEHYDILKTALEDLLGRLKDTCLNNDEKGASDIVDELGNKVKRLTAELSE